MTDVVESGRKTSPQAECGGVRGWHVKRVGVSSSTDLILNKLKGFLLTLFIIIKQQT